MKIHLLDQIMNKFDVTYRNRKVKGVDGTILTEQEGTKKQRQSFKIPELSTQIFTSGKV